MFDECVICSTISAMDAVSSSDAAATVWALADVGLRHRTEDAADTLSE
jgi:hypothetical protein